MVKEPHEGTVAGEAAIILGMAVVICACLFEWLIISPEHPGYALLRVLGAGLVATIGTTILAPR